VALFEVRKLLKETENKKKNARDVLKLLKGSVNYRSVWLTGRLNWLNETTILDQTNSKTFQHV